MEISNITLIRTRKEEAEKRLADEDQLSREIVMYLETDGRMAFSEIAQELSVSEGTIRNRVNRMKESGILRITAVVDPAGIEYRPSAILNIKVARGYSPAEVAERLGKQTSVVYILWVAGRYDLIIELAHETREELLDFLESHIFKSDDISDNEVLAGLKNFKNQFLLKRKWE